MSFSRNFGEHHDEIVDLSRLLLATWQEVDPRSPVAQYPASYVETFTVMAKAVVAAGFHRDPELHVSEATD